MLSFGFFGRWQHYSKWDRIRKQILEHFKLVNNKMNSFLFNSVCLYLLKMHMSRVVQTETWSNDSNRTIRGENDFSFEIFDKKISMFLRCDDAQETLEVSVASSIWMHLKETHNQTRHSIEWNWTNRQRKIIVFDIFTQNWWSRRSIQTN